MLKIIFRLGILLSLSVFFSFLSINNKVVHYAIQPSSKLYLVGTTNINTFNCNCQEPAVKGNFQLKEVENHTKFQCINAILKVKTESFDCKNRLMNRDLYKAMKSTQYPYITIQMLEIAQSPHKNLANHHDWVDLQANVLITITNVSKPMQLAIKAQKISTNQYHFIANNDLYMTDFNITPPTAGLGLVKVRNKITIHLDLIANVEN